jgi:hypothetical protein
MAAFICFGLVKRFDISRRKKRPVDVSLHSDVRTAYSLRYEASGKGQMRTFINLVKRVWRRLSHFGCQSEAVVPLQ